MTLLRMAQLLAEAGLPAGHGDRSGPSVDDGRRVGVRSGELVRQVGRNVDLSCSVAPILFPSFCLVAPLKLVQGPKRVPFFLSRVTEHLSPRFSATPSELGGFLGVAQMADI